MIRLQFMISYSDWIVCLNKVQHRGIQISLSCYEVQTPKQQHKNIKPIIQQVHLLILSVLIPSIFIILQSKPNFPYLHQTKHIRYTYIPSLTIRLHNILTIYYYLLSFMITLNLNRSAFSTIALFSGGVQNDSLTRRIIHHLKEEDPTLKFVGIAGTNSETDFKSIYAYSESFPKKPFEVLNYYKESLQEFPFSPYMGIYHWGNRKVLKKIESSSVYEELLKERVSGIINIGNWSFSRLFLANVNEFYKKKGILKPPVFFYDRSIYHRKVEHEQIIDYQFYQLPRKPDNYGNYIFPSMCIGYEALFSVYRYLAKYRRDHTFDYKQKTSFAQETEVLVQESRTEFRNGLGIGQDVFVIAIAPGKTQEQIDFTMARIPQTISKFFNSEQMTGYPIDKFELWVIPPRQKQKLDLNVPTSILPSLKIRYIQTADRIPALCSADVAIAHNGSVTVEAAACHLPTIVIDNRSMAQAYLSYLFNRYESPLNISVQKMGYQELLSNDSAIPQKLSTLLVDHFTNPKLKYFYIDMYQKPLKDMLEKSGRNINLNVEQSGLQTSCKMVLGEVKAYEHKDHGKIIKDWRYKRLSTIAE